jgi:3-dehydroquinate synthetase
VQRIEVNLGLRSYPIFIGAGAMRLKNALDRVIPANDVLVVTNTTVGPLYAAALGAAR